MQPRQMKNRKQTKKWRGNYKDEPVPEEETPEEAELSAEREGDPEMMQPADEERTEMPEGLDAAEANKEQEADEEMEREL